ncbi:MAG: hypothetical protein J6P62_05700 [Bacteroidales bacterium]|nr:hypothetical protein [Bacteroidales bacterium]
MINELETGMIRGKRQTMVTVSSWIADKVELARATSRTESAEKVLELTLVAMNALKKKIDEQLLDGVKTIDCADFLPD